MVYGQGADALLAAASAAGAATVDGIEVLVRQGALSLAIWTEREPPLAVMRPRRKIRPSRSARLPCSLHKMGCSGKGTLRACLAMGTVVAALGAFLPAAVLAAGETYFVAPNAEGGQGLHRSSPCRMADALEKAEDGDGVKLEEGSYTLPIGGVRITKQIDFGGGHDGEAGDGNDIDRRDRGGRRSKRDRARPLPLGRRDAATRIGFRGPGFRRLHRQQRPDLRTGGLRTEPGHGSPRQRLLGA